MYIRKAEKKDIPQIETLLYQVAKVHSDGRPDLFQTGTKKYTLEELNELLEDHTRPIYVAEEEGKILGYAFSIFQENHSNLLTHIKTLYIDDLCVLESIRGKGVGTKLYQHVLEIAKQSGCYNVTLNVWACNEEAKAFYEKCGLHVQKIGMEKILP
ncbi:MAG: GNAT family N-acetyltransferase [Eubacterium sp.]|nr:GNAT family N-acetyltransferase [Eubacterium sp.]